MKKAAPISCANCECSRESVERYAKRLRLQHAECGCRVDLHETELAKGKAA